MEGKLIMFLETMSDIYVFQKTSETNFDELVI